MIEPRDIKDGPFAWVSKAALKRIREVFDDVEFLDQALAVYLAHSVFASDEQNPTYDRTLRRISDVSGVSRTQVWRIHKRLKDAKLIAWTENKIDGTSTNSASTYTLLTIKPPSSTVKPPSSTVKPPSSKHQKRQLERLYKQSQKNPLKKLLINGVQSFSKEDGEAEKPEIQRDYVPLDTEIEWMEACRALFTAAELATYGGAWRNRFRDDRDKCQRVLRECLVMLREKTPVKSWAAYANDLYVRFSSSKQTESSLLRGLRAMKV